MTDVSVVVVTHNGGPDVTTALNSIISGSAFAVELVVVDNQSVDDTCQLAAQSGAVVIPLHRNIGYGGAANVGIQAASHDVVVVANQDILVAPNALARMLDNLIAAEGDGAVFSAPGLYRTNGTLAESVHALPRLHTEAVALAVSERMAGTRNITSQAGTYAGAWVSAAFVMARRSTWDTLGGFDPSYFMYVEDVDLFYRAHRAGVRVVWDPSAVVTHAGSSGPWSTETYCGVIRNWARYWRQRRNRKAGAYIFVMGWIGCCLRAVSFPLRAPRDPRQRAYGRMYAGTAWRLMWGK